jgi:hypothetical protein
MRKREGLTGEELGDFGGLRDGVMHSAVILQREHEILYDGRHTTGEEQRENSDGQRRHTTKRSEAR